jgi:hypothetical protein
MLAVKPAVESFTRRSWNLSSNYQVDDSKPRAPLGYDFMTYLRHLGFPSPLLDWTRSPYVAAFFAFRSNESGQDGNVAIYSYMEYAKGAKTVRDPDPWILGLGRHVPTHQRHYTQQSEYTICKKREDGHYVYWNHEAVFGKNIAGQDVLTKYVIPRRERTKVLGKLDRMNINSYSLFGDEESLMDTLAYQVIERS